MDNFKLNITTVKTVYFYCEPQWKRQKYEKREVNGLVFLTSGNVRYHYGDEYIYAQKGDILSFSDNVPYSGIRLDDNSVDCYVIDFKTTANPMFSELPIPVVTHSSNFDLYKEKFDKILSVWNKNYLTSEMMCKSMLYELLCDLLMLRFPTNTKNSEKVLDYINNNYSDSSLSIQSILKKFYVSESQLRRDIKRFTGMSPNSYINSLRIEKAKNLLLHYKKSVEETSYLCGFSSQFYFSRRFKEYTGYTPSEYKKNRLG